jgi:predicted permease
MLQSLQRAMTLNLGFEPRGAAALGFNLALQGYSAERGTAFQKQLMEQIRALPEVRSAAFASYLPLDLSMSNNGVYPDGEPEPPASKMPLAQVFGVSPDYFRTMGTKLLAGREFDQRDGPGAPRVVLVNEALVRQILKRNDPAAAIGKRIRIEGAAWEIVGVAEDGKYFSIAEAPKPVVFQSSLRDYSDNVRLVARTDGDPRLLLNRMREVVLSLEPDMAIYDPETMEEHLRLPLLPTKFAAASLAAFGGVTMLLAAVGIYGVMAYAVARRTREIGIRMAVGAGRGDVAALLLRRLGWMIGVAGVIGVASAMLLAGAIAPVLVGVNPRDPSVHLGGVAVMAVVALTACWVPARRAMRIDPLAALRQD